jgi:Recombination endonuclease VII
MAQQQMDLCAICDRKVELVVDHSHTTSKVRGLLCRRCNMCLGWYEKHAVRACQYLHEEVT